MDGGNKTQEEARTRLITGQQGHHRHQGGEVHKHIIDLFYDSTAEDHKENVEETEDVEGVNNDSNGDGNIKDKQQGQATSRRGRRKQHSVCIPLS